MLSFIHGVVFFLIVRLGCEKRGKNLKYSFLKIIEFFIFQNLFLKFFLIFKNFSYIPFFQPCLANFH